MPRSSVGASRGGWSFGQSTPHQKPEGSYDTRDFGKISEKKRRAPAAGSSHCLRKNENYPAERQLQFYDASAHPEPAGHAGEGVARDRGAKRRSRRGGRGAGQPRDESA